MRCFAEMARFCFEGTHSRLERETKRNTRFSTTIKFEYQQQAHVEKLSDSDRMSTLDE